MKSWLYENQGYLKVSHLKINYNKVNSTVNPIQYVGQGHKKVTILYINENQYISIHVKRNARYENDCNLLTDKANLFLFVKATTMTLNM